MEKKTTYKTPQKTAILDYLKKHNEDFLMPETIKEDLNKNGVVLSLVTIYRYLDRLLDENAVVKIPEPEGGKRFLYRYVGLDDKDFSHGKMVCLQCGKVIPLTCTLLETFYEHVRKEHDCALDYKRTVLYCTCSECLKKEASKADSH